MAQQKKHSNDFKDKIRPATITAVDPQNKQVDIAYLTQHGEAKRLNLSYQNVGLTWGRLYMPQVGDRVMVDYQQGELPTIVSMSPTNVDFLPYLDPGEMAETNSDGSYIHMRNARRRVKSTGTLIDYNATKGPNGETDIELEPGGIVIGVRSKQDISVKTPRWYEHSYISMFENGDIAIQSRYRQKNKGLLYFDGNSGYSIWTSGDGKPQEYVELDALNKRIVILTDGDIHQHTQKDWKITVYNNQVQNVADALQINVGVQQNQVSANFDQINVDTDLNPGDIRIDNHKTPDQAQKWDYTQRKFVPATGSGKFFVHTKGDFDLTVDKGNVNITVAQGDVNMSVAQGACTLIAQKDVDITSNGGNVNVAAGGSGDVNVSGDKVNVTATHGVFLNNGGGSANDQQVVTKGDLQNAITYHWHTGVQSGPSISGESPTTIQFPTSPGAPGGHNCFA